MKPAGQNPVTTVADARAGLSQTLKTFRGKGSAEPVILGSHRKPEAVLVPYATYLRLAGSAFVNRESEPLLASLVARRDLIHRLAALSNLHEVAVFGSVARGSETEGSDIDLLVSPDERASLFDFAQFASDMEQVFDRPVDVVSRRTLTGRPGDVIAAEAVSL